MVKQNFKILNSKYVVAPINKATDNLAYVSDFMLMY